MRHKTLASLLLLCGSTAALAHIAPGQTEPPVQNEVSNQATPAPEGPAPETMSNTTDVAPSSDPTNNGAETAPEPNSTFY